MSVVALVASSIIEIGQLHLAGRVASLLDVALNASGAVLTAWCAAVLQRKGLSGRLLVGLMIPAVAFVLVAHLIFARQLARQTLRLAAWDPRYEIVAGDEVDGGRAYAGVVLDARVCAGGATGLRCAGPAATLDERRALVDAAIAAQRIVLSARVVSSSPTQSGPARIVSFSRDASARNATLAQEWAHLVARIRTPLAGRNGYRYEFLLPEAVQVGDTTVVTAHFDGGRVSLSAMGTRRRATTFTFGLLDAWVLTRSLDRITPARLWRARLSTVLLACGPVIWLAAAVAARRRRRNLANRNAAMGARGVAETP